MILLADSGSTKTDWCIVGPKEYRVRISTGGMNPFFQSEKEMTDELASKLVPQLKSKPFDHIYFYGAGCAFPDKIESVRKAISSQLQVNADNVEVYTDMLAAARGLCGHQPGIACILGTGSNSCSYDGDQIIDNISPLGFILGDEGSGATLCRLLVGDLLKNQLTPGLKEQFFNRFNLTPAEIIDRVYRKPFPNRFLAGLSPFLSEHIDDPGINELILNNFKSFLKRNVMQYDYLHTKVNFIGSIAYFYQDILKKAAEEMNIQLGKIVRSPLEGLIKFHEKELK
ncbi:MAG: ATPase [Bacteroidaceae bacterium]|nr:ATPase [Bacteroidaceae bacterium]